MRPPFIVAALLLVGACTGGSSPAPLSTSGPPSSPSTSATATPTATPTLGPAYPDWPTYHGDLARTGVSTTMPRAGRTPAAHAVRLDGAVYASPVVVNGLVVVATEHNAVYGLTPSGRQRWHVNLGTPARSTELPCGNIDPLGVTGTPVYDTATRLVYVVAELGGPPRHRLVALDPATGAVRWHVSVDLPGVATSAMQERGALTVAGGQVWVPFGGLAGDCGGYKGRVVGVPLTGSHTPHAFTVPTAREGGIWTPPGPSVDAAGHLFVSVGNGASGRIGPYDHSDSVLKLTGTTIADSFSPTSWRSDNEGDLDLGSQGPALVGSRWVLIAGKSGVAYVLDQAHLGGIGGEVSQRSVCRSFGGTAVSGSVVYLPCVDGVRAVRVSSSGHLTVVWHAAGSTTGSPVLGGGLLWSLDPMGGLLHGLDPASGRSRVSTHVGTTSRFATPALWGPYVIVPTMAGVTFVRTS